MPKVPGRAPSLRRRRSREPALKEETVSIQEVLRHLQEVRIHIETNKRQLDTMAEAFEKIDKMFRERGIVYEVDKEFIINEEADIYDLL